MKGLTYDDLIKQLDWHSDAVSKAVRTTAFGVIAAIWTIFSADRISLNPTGLLWVPSDYSLRFAFVFAGGAILCDIAQYVSAYWMTNIGVSQFEKNEAAGKKVEFFYDSVNLGCFGLALYRLSFVLFLCKLALAILSSVAFLFLAFAISLVPAPSQQDMSKPTSHSELEQKALHASKAVISAIPNDGGKGR